jgi:hypothetical protein
MITAPNRPWYQGWVSLWLKDTGIATYFIPAVFSALLSPLFIYFEPIILNMLMMFAIVCIYSSLALQSVRLQATEWQSFVVNYQSHVINQGKVFIVIINSIMLLTIVFEPRLQLISTFLFANALGLGLWLLCRVTSHLFTTGCYTVFTAGIVSSVILEHPPLFLAPVAVGICLFLIIIKDKFGEPYRFNHRALAHYVAGLQSGWSPIPAGFLSGYSTYLNKQLFPLSYFVGPALSQFIILLVGISTTAVIVNFFYDITEPALFIFTNILLAIFTLCQWNRSQRTQSWELLYTLPIYNGVADTHNAFTQSALKFTACIGLFSFAFASLLMLPLQWECLTAANFALSVCCALLASFIIGNLVKNTSVMTIFLSISYGVHMALIITIFESDNSVIQFIILSLYTCSLSLLNRFSAKYI